MSRFARLAVVGLAFSICGCDLDKPLSDPAAAKVDERLFGRWTGVATKENPALEASMLFVGRHKIEGNPDGLMEALMVDYDAKEQTLGESISTRITYVSATKIGSLEILNVYFDEGGDSDDIKLLADFSDKNSYAKWTKQAKRSILLLRYTLEGDVLKLYPFDSSKLGNLAREGKLKKSGDKIAAESLAAYLEKNGAEGLLCTEEEAGVYKKLK